MDLKRLRHIFRQEKGSVTFHILFAVFLVGGLSFNAYRFLQDQEKLGQVIRSKNLIGYLDQELKDTLRIERNCTESLRGKSALKSEINEIKLVKESGAQTLFKVGQAFFDKIVTLEKMVLSGNAMELSRGITFLIMDYKNYDEILSLKVPITVQMDGSQNIVSCKAFPLGIEEGKSDIWNQSGEDITLKNFSLSIGLVPDRGNLFNVAGTMTLIPEELGECGNENEGVLKVGLDKKLMSCIENEWKNVGYFSIDWSKVTSYTSEIGYAGSKVVETVPHRYCYLNSKEFAGQFDECNISRVSESLKSVYKVEAKTSAITTKLTCEVSCVD